MAGVACFLCGSPTRYAFDRGRLRAAAAGSTNSDVLPVCLLPALQEGSTNVGAGPYLHSVLHPGLGVAAYAHRKASDEHIKLLALTRGLALTRDDIPAPCSIDVVEDKLGIRLPNTPSGGENYVLGLALDTAARMVRETRAPPCIHAWWWRAWLHHAVHAGGCAVNAHACMATGACMHGQGARVWMPCVCSAERQQRTCVACAHGLALYQRQHVSCLPTPCHTLRGWLRRRPCPTRSLLSAPT